MGRSGLEAGSVFPGLSAIERGNKGRAFQRYAEHRLESAVKNGIAGLVVEVGDKQRHRCVRTDGLRRDFRTEDKKNSNNNDSYPRSRPFRVSGKSERRLHGNDARARGGPLPYFDLLQKFFGAGKTFLWVDFQALPNNVTQRFRNRLIEFVERPCGLISALPELAHGGVGVEGHFAAEHFVENNSQAEK